MQCPECPGQLILKMRSSRRENKLFWGCNNYPYCRATHGAHPDGRPMGVPGNKPVRDYRRHLHALADRIWPWKDRTQKKKMYEWLRLNTKTGHISQLTGFELVDLEIKLKKLIKQRGL